MRARIGIAGNSRDDGTEMEWPGRRGCKAAAVGRRVWHKKQRPVARPCSGDLEKSALGLLFLDFIQALAVDTLAGRGACFEAADADFDTAGFAVAVFLFFNHR